MTIVGFDTSTAATSACVLRSGDGQAFEHVPAPSRLGEPPGHSRELLPAVAELMERAGVGWGDVEGVAVGVGPGTFTGLRIGVATARALATAADLPVYPVSSLAALAAALEEPLVLPLIDAKRRELFAALFERGQQVVAPFVARPDQVAARAGRDLANAVAVGDGSLRFRQILEAAGVRVPPDGSELHVVRALHVCRLAAEVPAQHPETVLPTYIRDPDAEPSQ
ncbi:MAG: tRNA threonylcarbamoyladenosine biosynthesis protein TsaB [Thermoleophilaceae bacterium]|jgi:tRNA threonylcarbamoyladenosine biosynthesis protein TsaB|nr:tRNA threonylcarbamoyladenosine biosynthesis protein TsaB [Thermoleophilaceae bacterium]